MKQIGIGLLGFGTVGAGVVEGLQRNGDLIAARLGAVPVLKGIADVDLERDRGVAVDSALLTRDAASLIEDPKVDIVVELIGGTGVAKDLLTLALTRGKSVVTANKALLAKHGEELFKLAAEKQCDIHFGASVGGGIPIIRALREGLIANRIDSIYGILNGTCNYILTQMESEGVSFDDALADAQARGYAEADPALDIDGLDTLHKAVILATLAYGLPVPLEGVLVEGIRGLSELDIGYGRELGYRVKLLAVIRRRDSEIDVRVHPAMVPWDHMLASVSGVYNAVMVGGDLAGHSLYYGRGAGREPTASTVIADIADACKALLTGSSRRLPTCVVSPGRETGLLRKGDSKVRCYLRLSLLDQPGVLARIASSLGQHGISIASVLQKEQQAGTYVPVVVVTHQAAEHSVDEALREIGAMDIVDAPTVRLRIEE